MMNQVQSLADVKDFSKQLIAEGLNFHPDEDFVNYVDVKSGIPTYTAEQAEFRNSLMLQCFLTAEKLGFDIYEAMLETTLLEKQMDKFIPLPSTL